MLAGLGNVRSRDLRRAMEERGWVHVRTEGGHHFYRLGRQAIPVPERLKGKGTIEKILKLVIAAEEATDGEANKSDA